MSEPLCVCVRGHEQAAESSSSKPWRNSALSFLTLIDYGSTERSRFSAVHPCYPFPHVPDMRDCSVDILRICEFHKHPIHFLRVQFVIELAHRLPNGFKGL